MNVYDEVIVATSLIILAIGLFGVAIYFEHKTKELEDRVDNLYSYFTAALEPQIKRIREVVNNEIINKKRDNANTCSKEKCPINAYTFKTCDLSENETVLMFLKDYFRYKEE